MMMMMIIIIILIIIIIIIMIVYNNNNINNVDDDDNDEDDEINAFSFFFFRVPEIGGNVHLLVQPSVDPILQILAAYENLRVLSLVNYSLVSISEDYFKHFINLETLFLGPVSPTFV